MASSAHPTPDALIPLLRTHGSLRTLAEPLLLELAAALRLRELAAGDAVFHEGDRSAGLVVVLSGRLRVSRTTADGELLLYNEMAPGDMQGEASLMLGQPRPADLTAARDSLIGELDEAAYEALLQRHPVAFHRLFADALARYLRHAPPPIEKRRTQVILLQPLADTPSLAHEARRLGVHLRAALQPVGRIELLAPAAATATEADLQEAHARIENLEAETEVLLILGEARASAWSRFALGHADQLVLLAEPDQSPQAGPLELWLRQEPGYSFKRQQVALLHARPGPLPSPAAPWRVGRPQVERVLPLRQGPGGDTARLARVLTGSAVGVVLGGGGARGFAHIGVLRALHEARIPVDLLGGNSMGALIGSQLALGHPLDSLRERILGFVAGGERPTLPVVSLLSGRRMERNLRQLCRLADVEPHTDGLWTPFFTAACNLSRACTTVLDSGPLWRAVLASNSPAGLLPPVPYQGDLLVDGAILDNVPVEAMRTRLGAKLERRRGNGTVIAVDVDVAEPLQVAPSRERIRMQDRLRGADDVPGIAQILYRAGHIGGMAQRERTLAQSDFYLEPPTSDFRLMGYKHAAALIERGYRHACEEIARWDPRRLPAIRA